MLFSNPAAPSQWKQRLGAAREAAACSGKAQVAAQATQLSVLGGSKDSSSKDLKISRPCKCYRAEVVTTLSTHRKHKAMNGCEKAEFVVDKAYGHLFIGWFCFQTLCI